MSVTHVYRADQAGQALQRVAVDLKDLKKNQIEIKVTCCGVCHSDVHFIENDWGDSSFPLVPGHEVVGVVTELGASVKGFEIGQRVGVSWQQGSCMECEWCLAGKESFCEQLKAICLHCPGGFADQMRVDSNFVYALPETLSDVDAAPLLCAGATVFHALTSNHVQAGMRIAIVGMGGLGHLAVQFAKALGCEVTVFSPDSSQELDAYRFGASQFIDNSDEQNVLSQKARFDFILITTSANLPCQHYIDALRPEGSLCFAGIPKKELEFSLFSLIIGQKSICATPLGHPNGIIKMLAFAAKHHIKPQTETMPMSEVNSALEKVKLGDAHYRIVLLNETNKNH